MRYAQSIQNNKYTISLQYLKENRKDKLIFWQPIKVKSFFKVTLSFSVCFWPGIPKSPKITSSLFLYNIFSQKWVIKLVFGMQINMKTCYKLILWFWCGWSSIPKVPKITSLQCLYNISRKKLERKLIFCMLINIKICPFWHYSFWLKWLDVFKVLKVGSW